MRLYERKNENGISVEWWTQRNIAGYYFSIIPVLNGLFAVVVNNDDASRTVFAVKDTFLEAERYLMEAAKIYT